MLKLLRCWLHGRVASSNILRTQYQMSRTDGESISASLPILDYMRVGPHLSSRPAESNPAANSQRARSPSELHARVAPPKCMGAGGSLSSSDGRWLLQWPHCCDGRAAAGALEARIRLRLGAEAVVAEAVLAGKRLIRQQLRACGADCAWLCCRSASACPRTAAAIATCAGAQSVAALPAPQPVASYI